MYSKISLPNEESESNQNSPKRKSKSELNDKVLVLGWLTRNEILNNLIQFSLFLFSKNVTDDVKQNMLLNYNRLIAKLNKLLALEPAKIDEIFCISKNNCLLIAVD